jgi:hypothetical protein
VFTAAVLATAALTSAGQAIAQDGPPPCEFALAFFCNILPMAPDLDHDIDLTQQLPPTDPNAPPPESLPVVDPCATGCI